jgi:enoyl-CoA hydratase
LKDGNHTVGGFDTLLFEKVGTIAEITLNRPHALNVYNIRMRDELNEVIHVLRDDPDVRVAIVRGAGDRAFCAGADLGEFLTAPSPTIGRQARFARDVWGAFLAVPQPVIAAVHGFVLGSGIEIALCCDIRIAAQDSRFGMPEVGLGIIPAAGGTQTLRRVTGRSAALELLLTGRWIGTEEAYRVGLVNQVVPRDELVPAARELAARIAAHSPRAVASAKQAIVRGLDCSLAEGLRLERRLATQVASAVGEATELRRAG